ncbi:MAG TPA: hypothetical protein VIC08_13935 [Cellvibrionaceae bacterium]
MIKNQRPAQQRPYALLWCLLLAMLTSSPVHAQHSAELTYLVSEVAAEPYQIVTETGEQTGLVTEIMQALLLGTEVSWQVKGHPYRRVQRMLLEDTYPDWVSYGAQSWLKPEIWARVGVIDQPLFRASYQLVTRAVDGLETPDALGQRRIIVIHGYRYGGKFSQWIEAQKHTLVGAPSHTHALAMLRMGRGDMYLAEDIRVQWEINRAGQGSDDLAIHDFSHMIAPIDIHIIYHRQLPQVLLQHMTQRLEALEHSGELRSIRTRYGAAASLAP